MSINAVCDILFSDDVITSTELNRRAGAVLDRAAVRPVTISRNNEMFALLRREYAARMVRTLAQMQTALTLLAEVHTVLNGEEVPTRFAWLQIYEKDDLQRLTDEIFQAVNKAASGAEDWNYVDLIIHEWCESAEIAKMGTLNEALSYESVDELPLINPETIIRYNESQTPLAGECLNPN